jgi:Protein containing tetrapyrrole methyltransferase domain and MazG-like (predicted pyrophosphatase) domain
MGFLEKKDIYLAGSGIRSFLDLTLYTQKILKECEVIYSTVGIPTLEDYLKGIAKRVVDLRSKYYLEGRNRMDIYRDITKHVMEGARKTPPVALLMHGHPLLFVTLAQWIQDLAGQEKLSVEVIPAVSCLDRLFVDLNLDIGPKGIQIFAANLAMSQNLPLNPRVDCLLFQIGAPFGLQHEFRPTYPEDIAPLQEYLLRYYPSENPVTVVESAIELGPESKLSHGRLGALQELALAFNYTASLYIPAAILPSSSEKIRKTEV